VPESGSPESGKRLGRPFRVVGSVYRARSARSSPEPAAGEGEHPASSCIPQDFDRSPEPRNSMAR